MRVVLKIGKAPRRVVASAMDWLGLDRSGKTEPAAEPWARTSDAGRHAIADAPPGHPRTTSPSRVPRRGPSKGQQDDTDPILASVSDQARGGHGRIEHRVAAVPRSRRRCRASLSVRNRRGSGQHDAGRLGGGEGGRDGPAARGRWTYRATGRAITLGPMHRARREP